MTTMRKSTRQRWQRLAALRGLVSEETGRRLAELASDVPSDCMIVEIGSFCGKSTCYLAEGAYLGRGAHVFAVDPWDLDGNPDGKHGFRSAREIFDEQTEAMAVSAGITAVRMFSAQAAEVLTRPVGLLFIDGSHEYADVRADWEAWFPMLTEGAVVAFDDYGTPRNPGVAQFVDELRAAYPEDEWEFELPLAICRRARS